MDREGRSRVIVEGVRPEIDAGRFPAKAVLGDPVTVWADVFTDGHDEVSCEVMWRRPQDDDWRTVPMEFVLNDRWRGSFTVTELGRYVYTVRGWVDHYKTWVHDLEKRVNAGQDVSVDLLIGAGLVERAAEAASARSDAEWDAERLWNFVKLLRDGESRDVRAATAMGEELRGLMSYWAPRPWVTTYERELEVDVDPPRAAFSSWYEVFPRSASPDPDRHGTLRDVEERVLPYVDRLGFDVLYLPPVHPIGTTARKGRDNYPEAETGDVGSPWAIGSEEGGHKSVHSELGTVEDLERLAHRARDEYGIELALDIAFQCSPDHPYVREHPEWFKHRPDGTIQYAENPPKKYQDIYPFDFESDAWESLWEELRSVFEFWIDKGVRTFRVDNPHTKAFPFWEWCIASIKRNNPDVIFLAEAFTRPKVMWQLAKLGFDQSYTYFAWRYDAWNMRQYFEELSTETIDFFRPNAWPNTPDILTEQLQYGGRPAYLQRLILAATLSSNYGIYGPAFEQMWSQAVRPGSEEYAGSEKYEIRHWDLDAEDSIAWFVERVNRIRREHPALHRLRNLRFHSVDNDTLLAYSKTTDDLDNVILCIVNLDTTWTQGGWVNLDLEALGVAPGQPYEVQDLITGSRYTWNGPANFVELNPNVLPGHVFLVRTHARDERDFPTF